MMLFDTDVLIWALRGSAKAAMAIDAADRRFMSAVNYMELMQGARNKREQALIRQFLNELGFVVLPLTEAISHRAVIIIDELALKSGIQLADALVAATACENSLTLCSANLKHFRGIASLDAKAFIPDRK